MIYKTTLRCSLLALSCVAFLVQANAPKSVTLTYTLEEKNTWWESGKGAVAGAALGALLGYNKHTDRNYDREGVRSQNAVYGAVIFGLAGYLYWCWDGYANNQKIYKRLEENKKSEKEAAALIAQDELDQASA